MIVKHKNNILAVINNNWFFGRSLMKKSCPGAKLACESGMNPYPLARFCVLTRKAGTVLHLVATGVK
jgi:hypothetical protein